MNIHNRHTLPLVKRRRSAFSEEPNRGTSCFRVDPAVGLRRKGWRTIGPARPEQPSDGATRCAEMPQTRSSQHSINYKRGSLYAVVTALLLSTQEPFSFLAAKQLSVIQFVFLTQIALLISIPLLVARRTSRRDLKALLGSASNYWKLAVLFAIGMAGLLLFKLALSNAHPIIISAVINLQPFWAALAALLIARCLFPFHHPSSSFV